MKLEENSIQINANVPVTFVTCKYLKGKSSLGKDWHCLEFTFKDEFDKVLKEKVFQPSSSSQNVEALSEKILFADKLRDILNTLSQKNLWDDIDKGPWESFYSQYLSKIWPFKNKRVFIKTVATKSWKSDGEMTAALADKDFISLSPDLEYTILEESGSEEFITEIIKVENKHFI